MMDVSSNDILAAEFVMGLTNDDEAAAAEKRLRHDPSFATQVRFWRERFSALDETAYRLEPSDALWWRIEGSVGGAQQAKRVAKTQLPAWDFVRLWESLGFWRVAGLATSAASVLLAVGVAILLRAQVEKPVMIAVLLTDANRPAAVVNVLANGEADLLPLDSIDVPAGRALQVWTLWDRARGPVSVGLSKSPQRIRLNLGALPKTAPEQLFEISLEPETGSPTGRPTGPVLMKGTASTPL